MTQMSRESARSLVRLAQQQGGYFTSKQAQDVGYAYPQLVYHVSSGNFERVHHGLYRLPTVPISEHDDLIRLSFWSRNQKDELQAVVSHESALVLHELSELLPGAIHLTVPPKFRKNPQPGCVLHKATLTESDVEEWSGFRVTTPLRTILDVAEDGVSQEQLAKAISDALSKGLMRLKSIQDVAKHSEAISIALGGKRPKR